MNVQFTVDDRQRKQRFKELQEFLTEESNRRKTSNAQTGRLCIDMAFKELERLREKKREKAKDWHKVEQRLKRYVEQL